MKIEKRKKTQHKTKYTWHVTLAWQIPFGKLLTPLAGESNYTVSKNIGAVAAMFRVVTATEGTFQAQTKVRQMLHIRNFQALFTHSLGINPRILFFYKMISYHLPLH